MVIVLSCAGTLLVTTEGECPVANESRMANMDKKSSEVMREKITVNPIAKMAYKRPTKKPPTPDMMVKSTMVAIPYTIANTIVK